MPAAAYHFDVGNLGYSRRSTVLFNDPDAVREIMRDADGIFPKSDLMVSALEHLIGDSIFVTDGERWKRQRAMIDPAFSHMRKKPAITKNAGILKTCRNWCVKTTNRNSPRLSGFWYR